ncbi:MAG: phage holin family protein [Dechloromonas sp.]|nr:phage holin family protein [Dechloromonas sp.]
MSETPAGGGRPGLFASLKGMLATLLDIGRTRAELLVTEIEEEKYRIIALWSKAIGAAFMLGIGVILGVFSLAFAFWEQRVLVFGLFAAIFFVMALLLLASLKKQAAQPSKLFRASLAELEADMAQLRRRDGGSE